jgi:hypothetical protein
MENKFIEDNFVSCEIAVKLKELDFDEECLAFYNHNKKLNTYINLDDKLLRNSQVTASGTYMAPLYQQVFQWFREKHSRTIVVSSFKHIDWTETASYFILSAEFGKIASDKFFHSYQEACVDAINKAIEIINKPQKTV